MKNLKYLQQISSRLRKSGFSALLFLCLTTRGAGIGGLGITVEGPSESKMSCKDNKDGSCSVEYVPYSAGLYDVNITYGGEHIPGESWAACNSDVPSLKRI